MGEPVAGARRGGVALLALPLVLGLAGCASTASSQQATLQVLAGTVEVITPEGVVAVAEDELLLTAGDTVRTSPDGRAEIDYPDGSLTRLDRSTTFTLEVLRGKADALEIEAVQASGNSYHRVIALTDTGSRFAVVTPTASAGVQGTEFAVFVEVAGSTIVAVLSAEVVVTSGAGEIRAVAVGEAVTVASDGIAGPVGPIPDELVRGDWLTFNGTEQGDATASLAPLAGARFEAVPLHDAIAYAGYPSGDRVIVVIRDEPGGTVLAATEFEATEEMPDIPLGFDLVVGNHVTLTHARTGHIKETTVVSLTIDAVDRSSDTIVGTADPGAVVVLFVEHEVEPLHEYVVTADRDGAWMVRTSSGVAGPVLDFDESYYLNVRIRDADGDTTLVHE